MQVEKGKKGKKSWTPKTTMTTARGSKARKGRRKVSLLPVQIDRRKGKEILPDPRKKKVSVNPPAAGPVTGTCGWTSDWKNLMYTLPLTFLSATTDTHFYNCSRRSKSE